MAQSDEPLPLPAAIPALSPYDGWAALLKLAGGNEDDAISALSGRLTGRLLLCAEIASKSSYAMAERKRVRTFEKLRAQIISSFEARRRSGALVLKAYTVAWPTRQVRIPAGLPLKYDFAKGTARSGDLQFHGVTVHKKSADAEKAVVASSRRISDAKLEIFCKRRLEKASPIPAMDVLWGEAKTEFPGKHVARDRVRALHRRLIAPSLRRSGPRKRMV